MKMHQNETVLKRSSSCATQELSRGYIINAQIKVIPYYTHQVSLWSAWHLYKAI